MRENSMHYNAVQCLPNLIFTFYRKPCSLLITSLPTLLWWICYASF